MSIITVAREGDQFNITLATEPVLERDELIDQSREVVVVETDEEEALAIRHAATLRGLQKQAEADRVALKRPFDAAASAIQSTFKDFATPLAKRIEELEKLVTARKARIAEALRKQAEAERAEKARLAREAADKLREAERLRAAAEKAKNDEDAAKLHAAAAAATFEAQDAAEAGAAVEVTDTKVHSTGGGFKETLGFEVTDVDAFVQWDINRRQSKADRALPTFVRVEVAKRDFTNFINTIGEETAKSIPGIKITKEASFNARAKQTTITLPHE